MWNADYHWLWNQEPRLKVLSSFLVLRYKWQKSFPDVMLLDQASYYGTCQWIWIYCRMTAHGVMASEHQHQCSSFISHLRYLTYRGVEQVCKSTDIDTFSVDYEVFESIGRFSSEKLWYQSRKYIITHTHISTFFRAIASIRLGKKRRRERWS